MPWPSCEEFVVSALRTLTDCHSGSSGKRNAILHFCCCCSVAKLCPTLPKLMDCTTHQAPLTFATSWSLFRFMSIESVMPSNHLNLCCLPSPFAFHLSQPQGLFQHPSLRTLQFYDLSWKAGHSWWASTRSSQPSLLELYQGQGSLD